MIGWKGDDVYDDRKLARYSSKTIGKQIHFARKGL